MAQLSCHLSDTQLPVCISLSKVSQAVLEKEKCDEDVMRAVILRAFYVLNEITYFIDHKSNPDCIKLFEIVLIAT